MRKAELPKQTVRSLRRESMVLHAQISEYRESLDYQFRKIEDQKRVILALNSRIDLKDAEVATLRYYLEAIFKMAIQPPKPMSALASTDRVTDGEYTPF